MRRFICPRCGAGINAPERLAKNDARRYCLVCSGETGKLVERTSPALERKRAAGRERSAAKTMTKRQKAAAAEAAKWAIGSFDIKAEAKRMWNLPTMRALPYGADHRRGVPAIDLRRRTGSYSSGRGSPWHGVTLTAGTDVAHALEVLLHELLHAALGDDTTSSHTRWHTPLFWSSLRSLAKEAWPLVDFEMQACPQRGYVIDDYLASRLRAWLKG